MHVEAILSFREPFVLVVSRQGGKQRADEGRAAETLKVPDKQPKVSCELSDYGMLASSGSFYFFGGRKSWHFLRCFRGKTFPSSENDSCEFL